MVDLNNIKVQNINIRNELLALELEKLLAKDYMNYIRSITFHTNGIVVIKTGSRAPIPRKIYSAPEVKIAVVKVLLDNY